MNEKGKNTPEATNFKNENHTLDQGSFNNHVDKKGWVGDLKNGHFCPRLVHKKCPRRQMGGQKRAKICQRGY